MSEQSIGRGTFLASCAAAAAAGALGGIARAQGAGFAQAQVQLDAAARGRRILAQFMGLTYESSLVPGSAYFSGGNHALIDYVKGLGRGVLHIGGSSAERTAYAESDLNALAEFAKATNWPVLLGVGLFNESRDQLAQEANLASQTLGERLMAFEIGSAPDLRMGDYGAFAQQFRNVAQVIAGNVPSAHFAGPGAVHRYDWASQLAHDERANLVLLTQQYYHTAPDDAQLLTMLQSLQKTADDTSLPYRLVNVRSTGGNTLNAALWALDLCFAVAQSGADGINFHDAGDAVSAPQYLALQIFAQSVDAQMVPATVRTANTNLSAYAVQRADGTRVVTIVNRDRDAGAALTLDYGRPASRARVRRLSALGLGSGQVTLTPWQNFEGTSLDVPPGSAALIEV